MSGQGYISANIGNQALISLGHPRVLGSLRDGSKEANAILEVYAPSVEEISRAAHWNALRRQANLTLLNYQNGATYPAAGSGTPGMGQWIYEYAWPIDCMKARYVPYNNGATTPVPAGNIVPANSSSPLTGNLNLFPTARTIPAPFLVSQDIVPNVQGAINSWSQAPDFDGAQGQSWSQQTVILTNVQNASLVYTALVESPNVWDPLFRQAVVCLIASKIALVVVEDKKMAMQMQALVIARAKAALQQARISDGNEGPTNINHDAGWIKARGAGGWSDRGYDGPGCLWGQYDAAPFPDGSCY